MTAHILFVDKNDATCIATSRLLQDAGYSVCSSNGETAFALLQRESFDVVITEIQAHHLDGIHLIKIARKLDLPPAVMILTSNSTLDIILNALRAGAYDYLVKPVSPEELLDRIQLAIKRRNEENIHTQAFRRVMRLVSSGKQ